MGKLWAITSFFNPAGYQRRLENYQVFRKHLGVPVVTAELSYDGQFALRESDADILLRLNGADVMWQKERLLNLAVDSLPDECKYIAWIDCDVIFEKPDWAEAAMEALETFNLVHLFQERKDLPKDADLAMAFQGDAHSAAAGTRPSTGYRIVLGDSVQEDYQRVSGEAKSTTGLAWGCRRELLQTHGLYDACIVGGGDRVILGSAMGWLELTADYHKMFGARRDHYFAWAQAFHQSVQGKVGYIDGSLVHLWHGEIKNRRYVSRLNILPRHDYTPQHDIALDANGVWTWASAKPALHQEVSEYLEGRQEDGRAS